MRCTRFDLPNPRVRVFPDVDDDDEQRFGDEEIRASEFSEDTSDKVTAGILRREDGREGRKEGRKCCESIAFIRYLIYSKTSEVLGGDT